MPDQKTLYATRRDKMDYLSAHCLLPENAGDMTIYANRPRARTRAPRLATDWRSLTRPAEDATTTPAGGHRRQAAALRSAQAARLLRAAQGYQRAFAYLRSMSIANPGHAALPGLSDRLDAARETLFGALRRVHDAD